jgi:hypothetical protein
MELDFSRHLWLLISMVVILLLAILGWVGYAYLPAGDRLLTYSEWQVLKANHTYENELGKLQGAAETLAELLNAQPDPVRTQMAVESILRLTSKGHPALAYPRDKVALAAQSVRDWAVGAQDRETALQALIEMIQVLSPQPTPPAAGYLSMLVFLPAVFRH